MLRPQSQCDGSDGQCAHHAASDNVICRSDKHFGDSCTDTTEKRMRDRGTEGDTGHGEERSAAELSLGMGSTCTLRMFGNKKSLNFRPCRPLLKDILDCHERKRSPSRFDLIQSATHDTVTSKDMLCDENQLQLVALSAAAPLLCQSTSPSFFQRG